MIRRLPLYCLTIMSVLSATRGFTADKGVAAAVAVLPASGKPAAGGRELEIVVDGKSNAQILVSSEAGKWEKQAAADLARYIKLMSGADLPVLNTADAVAQALKTDKPLLIVGGAALKAEPGLRAILGETAKKNPHIRAEAVVVQRRRNRIYMAGLTDDGHYHAVSQLLHAWGCRWYMPTDFGECVPEHASLKAGQLDYAYAPPFEIRDGKPLHLMAWLGSAKGWGEFGARNFKSVAIPGYPDSPNRGVPNAGHSLGDYIKDALPEGRNIFNSPIAEESVMDHVAAKVETAFQQGNNIDLGINDGAYSPSGSRRDEQLQAGLWDKYFVNVSMSDVFLTLYNGVAERLLKKYPDSPSKIAFFIYTNLTIPPQQVRRAARPLYGVLAPIDVDPNHGMDDPHSPPRQEYREIMYRWAEVMEGRVCIYDYDQGMLVWRDLPNPSHQAFRQDVKHYRKAGILGFTTESRSAFATIFLNMYFRAQLMWNPDFDVDAALAEFYEKFYGPAAAPMAQYWNAVFKAWQDSICTEHEFFAAPAIYTPELIESLRPHVAAAEQAVLGLAATSGRNEKLYLERVRFTRLSFDLIAQYIGMVRLAAAECDYAKAAALGREALATRQKIGDMNEIFISTRMGEKGPAWFPGEVELYAQLAELMNGKRGELIAKLPLEWAFLRDPTDSGLPGGVAYRPIDLAYWDAHRDAQTGWARKDYPIMTWELVRTDLYPQAQGILHPDGQSYTGYSWYKTEVTLKRGHENRKVHIRFPGLFGRAWLYVNGWLVEFRPQQDMWWCNDYSFSWDVDLTDKLHAGVNQIAVRNFNNHHVSGMFRRPFLYEPKD